MHHLSAIQRRFLALLEESGQDHLPALINAAAVLRGDAEEVKIASAALTELVKAKYIELSVDWGEATREWVVMPTKQSLVILESLSAMLDWSASRRLWIWKDEFPMPEVLATNIGTAMAHQILSEDGWPDAPLDRYA
jgi:hypothetical protein